jgi:hypothetical protein
MNNTMIPQSPDPKQDLFGIISEAFGIAPQVKPPMTYCLKCGQPAVIADCVRGFDLVHTEDGSDPCEGHVCPDCQCTCATDYDGLTLCPPCEKQRERDWQRMNGERTCEGCKSSYRPFGMIRFKHLCINCAMEAAA